MRAQQCGRLTVRTAPIAATSRPKTRATVPISEAANACKNCGAKLAIRKRVYCDACLPAEMQRIQREVIPKFQIAGQAKMARMRASGIDPSKTPEAQERRAATAMQQRRANVAWTDDGSLDGVDFVRDILPGLQGASVRKIAASIAVSLAYASKIRNGRLIPHKRHWQTLSVTWNELT